MARLAEVCRYVRSKNAGPFWITVDLFFPDRAAFDRYADAPALQSSTVADRLGVRAADVKRFAIPDLLVVKLSYPRQRPQGGALERDMHGGQQFVPLLDIEL